MGTYLARPVRHKEREDGDGPRGLRFGAVSMQGWRIAQEDAHLALPRFDEQLNLGLFAVFDGHRGGVVSRLVAEWLPAELRNTPGFKAGEYPRALHEALLALDRRLDSRAGRQEVHRRASKMQMQLVNQLRFQGTLTEDVNLEEALQELCYDNPDDMGCTAIVALLDYGSGPPHARPARVYVANCGDSRCVSWDAAGRVAALSKDHKPRCHIERARVEAAGGWVTSEGRIEGDYNLSRALGDFAYKRTRREGRPEDQMITCVPEVRSRVLRPSDNFLLLGCDGLWETRRGSRATVDLLRSILGTEAPAKVGETMSSRRRAQKLSASLGKLLDSTVAKETASGLGMDNITAVLVQFPLPPGSEPTRAAAAAPAPPRRGPGRPRKHPPAASAAKPGRKPGRPRKQPLAEPAAKSGRKPRGIRPTIRKRPAASRGRTARPRSGPGLGPRPTPDNAVGKKDP